MTSLSSAQVMEWLAVVKDPEIPVISIKDLGILQKVKIEDEDHVVVEIIPTYSGCPAMFAIKADVLETLKQHGVNDATINLVNDPIWTTDMITAAGREAMQAYGIAPPLEPNERHISCPQCGATTTSLISQFGSTACKALYRCDSCLEPFDYFKCHA